MSKSRGTFVTARRYLDRLPPEPLRYYFAAKLSSGIEDIDFSLDDFVARTNSDLVGKLVNIASRCAGFIERGGGQLAAALPDPALYQQFVAAGESIAQLYETREYATAMREIMELADRANRYVDQHKPWALAKDPNQSEQVRAIATQGLNLFRVLQSYLAPVLPDIASASAAFLRTNFSDWNAIELPLLKCPIAAYRPLATRLDPAIVATLIDPTTTTPAAAPATAAATALKAAAVKAGSVAAAAGPTALVGIDDFAKLDLRVARVVHAQQVDGSAKLLRLTLDLGNEQRTVFSGIRTAYPPEQIQGRLVIMIANLAPRKMRFGVSQGMVLCASGDDDAGGIFLLAADSGARAGYEGDLTCELRQMAAAAPVQDQRVAGRHSAQVGEMRHPLDVPNTPWASSARRVQA